MTISDSLYFMYDGINSQDMGIVNCHLDSGMQQETFLASRSIKEQKVRGKSSPYFIELEPSPLTLKLTLAFEDSFDEDGLRAVSRWLNTDFYKPLIFSESPERIFYALYIDDNQLTHAISRGYITITFRCSSPYTFSPVYTSPVYDLSYNTINGTEIEIINSGDLNMDAIITIQVINGGTFSIINKSDSGKTISFSNIADNETITIDTEHEEIETDIANTYRFSNMTGEFYNFIRGINRLQILGNIKAQLTYEFKTLF